MVRPCLLPFKPNPTNFCLFKITVCYLENTLTDNCHARAHINHKNKLQYFLTAPNNPAWRALTLQPEKIAMLERLKKIKDLSFMNNILNVVAMIANAGWILGVFGNNPASLHPQFGNGAFVSALIFFAVALTLFCGYRTFKLGLEKSRIIKKLSIE